MKKITNYHDLVAEKLRLRQKLALLKRDMSLEVQDIKDKFSFITKIVGFLTGHKDHKSHNNGQSRNHTLLKYGAALGVDLLVGPRLAKAGLLTRMAVPPLIRGVASNIHKIVDFFKRRKK